MIVFRKEVKYMLDLLSAKKIDQLLNQILSKDPYCIEKDYYIRSLYFDEINDFDFFSKMNGDLSRKKIRLRTYDLNSDKVKLEIKRKENTEQVKESIVISRADAMRLMACDYGVLLNYKEKVARTIYNIMTVGQYRPRALVDYYRRAYIYKENDIRITLDYDIRSSESDLNFFNSDLLLPPVFNENTVVLEVKYTGVFPGWLKESLGEKGFSSQSVSKYCTGRRWLY